MSYILEALKKADRERTLGDVPDLETAHWGERRARRSFRWVWVVFALLLVNGGLLVYMLGRDDGKGERVDGAVNETVEDVREYKLPHADSMAVQTSRNIARPREPVYAPPPPVHRARPAVQYAPAPAGTAPPGYIAQPDTALPPVAGSSASGIPYWDDLPLEFRSGLLLPHVDVHVYDDDPARRFILVDLVKFREGEVLDSGAAIEQINKSSIQLNYNGTRFLMEL